MSGTLFPVKMYSDLLRIPNEDGRLLHTREYDSPFLSERRPILIAQNTTLDTLIEVKVILTISRSYY